jgi:hypothetical protein
MSKNGNGNGGSNGNGNGVVGDFVREAIREKAARELSALNQRADVFGGVERARDGLFTVATELTNAASAVAAVATDAVVTAKMKKLRKLVEDANVLATEIADVLGVDKQREAVASARQSILDALKTAGIDPNGVFTAEGGDAQ